MCSMEPGTKDLLILHKTSFFFLAVPHGLWNLSSLIMDGTYVPCIGSTEH